MNQRVFAVISKRAITHHIGFRQLVDAKFFENKRNKLVIEVMLDPSDSYIPVNERIRGLFPMIGRAYIDYIIFQY